MTEPKGSAGSPHPVSPEPSSPLIFEEVATLSALLDSMFPSDELGPGALEIGVPEYIQGALAGPYRSLVSIYRRALVVLNGVANREHGRSFSEISVSQRDAIISRLEHGQLEELHDTEAEMFFELIWKHLREGLFSDPIHGGNRQMLGWRLIGFPGAQFGYTAEEQQLDVAIVREPRSVADLRGNAHKDRQK